MPPRIDQIKPCGFSGDGEHASQAILWLIDRKPAAFSGDSASGNMVSGVSTRGSGAVGYVDTRLNWSEVINFNKGFVNRESIRRKCTIHILFRPSFANRTIYDRRNRYPGICA